MIKKVFLFAIMSLGLFQGLFIYQVYAQQEISPNFEKALNESVDDSIADKVTSDSINNEAGAEAVNELVKRVVTNIGIPLVVIAGAIMAIIGFYQMMVSEDTNEISKGTNYILWGIVGIVLMVLAHYITSIIWSEEVMNAGMGGFDAVSTVEAIYQKIVYPLLKVGLYLGIAMLFVLLVIRVFKYLSSSEDENQKSTINIIIANIIGIVVILGSKQLVEVVYGRQDEVLNRNALNTGEIGKGLLNEKTIPLIFDVLKWVMSLSAFIIVVILIFLGFKLLTNPEKDDALDLIKKNILYVAIGVLVIGGCYFLTNFLIVN